MNFTKQFMHCIALLDVWKIFRKKKNLQTSSALNSKFVLLYCLFAHYRPLAANTKILPHLIQLSTHKLLHFLANRPNSIVL